MFSKLRVSFDIKDNIVKITEGKLLDIDVIKIKKAAYLDMTNGVFEDGRLISCQENIDALSNFLKKNKFKANKALLNISDSKIVNRVINLPKLSISDLNSLINAEAHKYFPIDVSNYHIDYRILDSFNQNEKIYYKILLCAVPKYIIREYIDLFTGCGLKLTLIDIHSNSVSRLYENDEYEDIAIIDGNSKSLEFIILEKGNYFINTAFPFEINDYSSLLRHPKEYDSTLMNDTINNVIKSIQKYINFYLTKNEGKNIDKIYLVGDITLIEGIESRLTEGLRINVIKGYDDYIDAVKSRKAKNMAGEFYAGNIGIHLRGV